MEDSDILTLGWGCEPGPTPSLWPVTSEEFVTLDMDSCSSGGESQDYVTLEVCKERDKAFYNSQQEHEKMQVPSHYEWEARPDLFRTHQTRTPIPSYNECFYPQYSQPPPLPHYDPYYHAQPTYQPQPYPAYSPPNDPRRHAARSPTSGKFVRGYQHMPARAQPPAPPDLLAHLPQMQEKERKRPGPKPKTKAEGQEDKDGVEGPIYDQATIDAAHLTVVDDHYVCSVCKMKFKQPGNARRHIITVHRNEKPHECSVCSTKFGRKDKLKTHMIRNHGFDHEEIKKTFQHSGSGRKRSSIVVNRKGRDSTESTSDEERESNPLNLKTYSTEKKAVSNSSKLHLDNSPSKRSRV